MIFYETESVTPQSDCPRHLRNKTADEIVAYLTERFNSNPESGEAANKSTAYMRAVAAAIFDPTDWKAPIYAKFPKCGQEWVKAAIVWYHGTRPLESAIGIYSQGYSC